MSWGFTHHKKFSFQAEIAAYFLGKYLDTSLSKNNRQKSWPINLPHAGKKPLQGGGGYFKFPKWDFFEVLL